MGAFGPNLFPLKICKGTARFNVLVSNPCKGMVGFSETQSAHRSLEGFNGQESWPKGTHDSVLCPLLPQVQPLQLFSVANKNWITNSMLI